MVDPGSLRLHDVGIVGLEKAIKDKAPGASDEAAEACMRPKQIKKHYWCTLCGRYYVRSTAYEHVTRHAGAFGTMEELHTALDEKYGMHAEYCCQGGGPPDTIVSLLQRGLHIACAGSLHACDAQFCT
jgi:hypothetical protein